jgi:hypothetical protein
MALLCSLNIMWKNAPHIKWLSGFDGRCLQHGFALFKNLKHVNMDGKNNFLNGEIHGVTLYPASVSNIYVSLYDHDYILLSSR